MAGRIEPLDEATRRRLVRQRRRDTNPELRLRGELHRRGLRYRLDRSPITGQRLRADILFGPTRVAVFVDGCFWHVCPIHGSTPSNNHDWWRQKLAANQQRDLRVSALLEAAGWVVLRFWEHDDVQQAADEIERVVRGRRANSAPPGRRTDLSGR